MAGFWQMAWEQDVHLLVMLSSIDGQECIPFWPDGPGGHCFFNSGHQKMKVTLMDELDTAMWKAMRLSLEVSLPFENRLKKLFKPVLAFWI